METMSIYSQEFRNTASCAIVCAIEWESAETGAEMFICRIVEGEV